MSARFARLLDDGSGDILIACVDDARAPLIPAHRAFLSSASESLRTLMALQLDGAAQHAVGAHGRSLPRLALHGIKADTVRAVLRHIYTGATAVDVHNAVDLVIASEKFGLEALEDRVTQFLPRLLRDDNVCAVLITAAECVVAAQRRRRAPLNFLPTPLISLSLPFPPLASCAQPPRLFPAHARLRLPAAAL